MKTSLDLKFHVNWLRNRHLPRNRQRHGTFSRFSAQGQDMTYIYLAHANLESANLSKADLSEANLTDTDLTEAELVKSRLVYADLSKANLSRANLSEANLSHANLSLANLSLANLSGAKFGSTNIRNTDLSGSALENIEWIQPIGKGYKSSNDDGWPNVRGWETANFADSTGVIVTNDKNSYVLSYVNGNNICFLYSRPVSQECYSKYIVRNETLCYLSHTSFLDKTLLFEKEVIVDIITEHINLTSLYALGLVSSAMQEHEEGYIADWITEVKSKYSFVGDDQIKLILDAADI